MMQLNPLKLLLIMTGAVSISLLLFLYLIRRYFRSRNLQLPFTQNLLRTPGQSILTELNHLNQELLIYFVFLILRQSTPMLHIYPICISLKSHSISMNWHYSVYSRFF